MAKEANLRTYYVFKMTQMCLSIGGCSMKLGVTVPCSQAECCCLADTPTEAFRRRAFMLFVQQSQYSCSCKCWTYHL